MISDRRATSRDGEPELHIVVTGTHDVYRFAHHLQRGQCEFAEVGFRTTRYLKRKLGKGHYGWLLRFMHGDGGFR